LGWDSVGAVWLVVGRPRRWFLNDLSNLEEEVTEFMDAQSKKKSCVSSGFTLIELLVVIAIIAR
jgi:prepilin-type N-terminal cleavage/methylation domain-containing protein